MNTLSENARRIAIIAICSFMVTSCAIGPSYDPPFRAESSGVDMSGRRVVVSNFYKAKTELSYLGDLQISYILERAKLYDASFAVASHLKRNGIDANAVKDATVDSLVEDEVLLSGTIVTRSIPMEENFPFPGMLIVLLIGNILPSPAAYVSGVDVVYRYELVDTNGMVLFSSPEKETRISYRDHWIWGRIFFYKSYERDINETLDQEIYDLIVADLFR
jgi:hypothetical protein